MTTSTQLSPEIIIDICNKAILLVKPSDYFLCNILRRVLTEHTHLKHTQILLEKNIVNYIPEFTFKNAEKHANAKYCMGNIWWIPNEFHLINRIKFLEWIIEQNQLKINNHGNTTQNNHLSSRGI